MHWLIRNPYLEKRMTYLKLAIAALFIFGATACNTMEGLGEDIEAGGQELENSAEKQKRK